MKYRSKLETYSLMRVWSELLLLFSNFAVGFKVEDGEVDCCCERNNNHKKKRRNKSRARERERGGKPVMFWSTLLRIITTLVLIVRKRFGLVRKKVTEFQPIRYQTSPFSPLTESRLLSVKRKIMVLDLDETLIHSHHDDYGHPLLLPDFLVTVTIETRLVKFFVYKRPHVDFFLSIICQWYDLVIFTASMQKYGMEVANRLDQNKGILPRRYFRQDCTVDMNGYTKDLTMVSEDLSNIFILDNSPAAYRGNPDNAIPIRSWFSDPTDTALLDLLPFLDALRFTQDVRSVLSRNLHEQTLC